MHIRYRMRPLGSVTGAVGLHIGKMSYAYFHLPTADLSRCNVFHLVHLEMLQNCSLQGFGTVHVSSEKPKYLQIAKNEKLLLEGNNLFTTESDLSFNSCCWVINAALNIHLEQM